ncbi:MAG TPA: glycoside hydrolase family 88 protein [Flavisolibacter sp.]|jgi:rhamnogalacturonyl hydrolase YesR|nr:glycoside hydrolase family 88 protein [Flavisolibacter sp.]
MKRITYITAAAVWLLLQACKTQAPGAHTGKAWKAPEGVVIQQIMDDAQQQTRLMLKAVPEAAKWLAEANAAAGKAAPDAFSPRTAEQGKLKLVNSRDWTSGFFPGELWLLYEYTGNKEWRDAAEAYTVRMEREKTNGDTHDMGFKMYCSFGNGYKLTKDAHYKEVLIQSARTLITRFNPAIGCIRSWDHHKEQWVFPVIIDNMMNLELLFAATRLSGDSSFYKIAVQHANTTMKNHFRPDFSSYHVVDYDPVTGAVRSKNTAQGYADESAWARGQAWGLYGYTMCFRETGNRAYLDQAEHIAAFILNHPNLPADKVPFWDYNDPAIPKAPKDASAAAIMASALYELSLYSTRGESYVRTADRILESLSGNYRSAIGQGNDFLLQHSTGHKPANSEIDVPIIYADYYYLEALLRRNQFMKAHTLFMPL